MLKCTLIRISQNKIKVLKTHFKHIIPESIVVKIVTGSIQSLEGGFRTNLHVDLLHRYHSFSILNV